MHGFDKTTVPGLRWQGGHRQERDTASRSEMTILAYDQAVERFGEVAGTETREQKARAEVNKGIMLGELGRFEEAVLTYEQVVNRFGEATESALDVDNVAVCIWS
jgi:tetratricopeptide (TPR) repeat protein